MKFILQIICLKKKNLSLGKIEKLLHVSALMLFHVLFKNWKRASLEGEPVLKLQGDVGGTVVCETVPHSWKGSTRNHSLNAFPSYFWCKCI